MDYHEILDGTSLKVTCKEVLGPVGFILNKFPLKAQGHRNTSSTHTVLLACLLHVYF